MSAEAKNKYTHSEEFRRAFGNRLRETRKKAGLTIDQARTALKVPRSTYSGWELGTRIPLNKSLDNVADLLGTTVDFLMLKTDDPRTEASKELEVILSDVTGVTYKGKLITDEQRNTISALIEAYLNDKK